MAAYEITCTRSPSTLKRNGVALTEYASRTLADAAGTGWVDEVAASSRLYLVLASGDPYTDTIVALFPFYFATEPKIFNNIYYHPLIESVPNLSMRVEEDFDTAQVGGGSMAFTNLGGTFSALNDYRWDIGTTTIKMGVDYTEPSGTANAMAYADYETKAVYVNGRHELDEASFKLTLREPKSRIRKTLPLTFFNRTDYPLLKQEDIGKPVPLAYGQIYGAPAVCTNTTTRTFTIASHAVYSIGEVYYLNTSTNVWTAITPSSTNTTTATFVLPSTWDGRAPVKVDFVGRMNSDGSPMVNASDVVKDILAQVSETNINTSSFTASKTALRVGTDAVSGFGVEANPISLWLGEKTTALEAVSRVNQTAHAYLYTDGSGTFYHQAFYPQPSNGLTTLTDADFISIEIETNAETVKTQVVASYGQRLAESWGQTYTYTNTTALYAGDLPSHVVLSGEPDTDTEASATLWAQRMAHYYAKPAVMVKIDMPWKGILHTPGSQLRIDYADNSVDIDAVYEVLEQRVNLGQGRVSLVLGNLHGVGVAPCFVSDAAGTLSTKFATFTGYSAGVLDWSTSWDDDIKRWALQNAAYCTDSNGFATTADPESFQGSKVI